MASSSRSSGRPRDTQVPEMQIGDFIRKQEIGKGSFATVYLASHRKKRSYAAVKSIHTSKLTSRLKQNLDSEIRILKQLQHPHIVALFACLDSPGNIHIVMEYCQMSDLAHFMKSRHKLETLEETAHIFNKYPNSQQGGLHEVLARHFLKQTTSGMQYLREKHIVHRDLKPQNLLLNPPPTIMQNLRPEDVPLAVSEHSLIPAAGIPSLPMLKIADFGFARHLPAASLAETLCGSPLYMAPEILNYQKYDAKADLWSVGTIAYEMVVGKPPFRASNHIELLKKIKASQDVIPFPAGVVISQDYKDLVRSLLKQDPVARSSFERYFRSRVVVDEIPGLVEEDVPQKSTAPIDLAMSQLTDRLRKQDINSHAQDREDNTPPPPPRYPMMTKPLPEPPTQLPAANAGRKPSAEGLIRKLSVASASPKSQEPVRRPSLHSHVYTAPPGRMDTQKAPQQDPDAGRDFTRRNNRFQSSTSVPQKSVMAEQFRQEKALGKAKVRNNTEDDIAFEREWVKIDKQATEVNALADMLEDRFQHTANQNAGLVRRATTQGSPNSVSGAQPSVQSNAMANIVGRRADPIHARQPSFERRYAPNPPSFATSALQKVLNAANARLFGSVGTSPPFGLGFGKGQSPPQGYGAFPQYPAPLPALLTDGRGSPGPMDEDAKMCHAVEQAATRSDVVYGFAEVKYRQLLPATPSGDDASSIRPLGNLEQPLDGEALDKELTQIAIAAVAEEAFVLYVKALSILLRTINLARYWWERHRPSDLQPGTSLPTNIRSVDASKRMNNVVQWARNRFNECLEKSELVGRRLIEAQKQLPLSNPGHPSNHGAAENSGSGNNFGLPLEQIHLTSGITAERLMYERALEMSRAAAVQELVQGKDEWHSSELSYVTACCLYEAVLENDDDISFSLPSQSKGKSSSEIVNGLDGDDRATVVNMVNGTRERLDGLRKKIAAYNAHQNAAKRLSATSLPKGLSRTSSTSSPIPNMGTPPK